MKRRLLTALLSITISIGLANPPLIKFMQNKGQWPSSVMYMTDLPAGKVFFQKDGLRYVFYDSEKLQSLHGHTSGVGHARADEGGTEQGMIKGHVFDLNFLNANQDVAIESESSLSTNFNYFFGENQVGNVKAFNQITYKSLYEGIDATFYYRESLKYDLIVAPEANPEQIQFGYDGTEQVEIVNGNILITTSVNEVLELRPFAYQLIDGKKVVIPCNYKLDGDQLSFEFPVGYDECHELIIDPALIFSTYSGSTSDNWGNTATYDDKGNLYSGGITNHYSGGQFPATTGAFQTSTQGLWDLAILKYDSTGTELIYATYIGGSNSELPQSLVAHGDQLVIMGVTGSSDYPTTFAAYDRTFNGGAFTTPFGSAGDNVFFSSGTDIFITKLSASGSSLAGSTFIGGGFNDGIMGGTDLLTKNYGDQSRGDVFISSDESIVVASKTSASDFPIVNGFQSTYAGGTTDAVVFSMTKNLTDLNWSTFIGGSGMDAAYSVKENSEGNFVLGGGTTSTNIHANFTNTINGGVDGWIAEITADGTELNTAAYLGTGSYDQVYFVDLDIDDNVYTYGQSSGSFPVVGSVYSSGGGQFIQKRTADMGTVVWSTRFGAGDNGPDISPTAFLVNECDNIYISGWGGGTNAGYIGGSTTGLPITSDAYQSTTEGSDFYLMTLDSDASELLYATFLGGTQSNTHVDGGTSRFDKRGIVYHAVCAGCAAGNASGGPSSDFPATNGAWSVTNNSQNCNNAAFKFDLASLRAVLQTNNTSLNDPGYNIVCVPDSIVFQNFSIGGELFEWDFGDGQELTRTDTAYIVYQYGTAGVYTVTLKALDPNTCIAEDEATTTVQVFNPMQRSGDDATICFGEEFQLTAVGGTEFEWVSEDSTFTSNKANPIVQPEDSITYYVRIRDQFCETLDTLNVAVIPETNFDFDIEKVHDCISRPSLKLTNNIEDGAYTWDFGDGNTSEELNLTYDYENDGTYTVRILSENDKCVFEREVTVEMVTVKVPNVFTPTDGEPNATFEILSASKEHLRIFNRWGSLVFENKDYQDDWTGEEVPAGVYYYEAVIENEITCAGWVQVLK